jgi:hypothetical protein
VNAAARKSNPDDSRPDQEGNLGATAARWHQLSEKVLDPRRELDASAAAISSS